MKSGTVSLSTVLGSENTADLGTKVFTGPKIEQYSLEFGLIDLDDESLVRRVNVRTVTNNAQTVDLLTRLLESLQANS